MNLAKRQFLFTFAIFLTGFFSKAYCLSLSGLENNLTNLFYNSIDQYEGTTTFRSLLIPIGGYTESMGDAFTGLCDDISYLRYNPSAGALQKESQLALFHNSWIADSKMETLAFTTRLKNHKDFGYGFYLSSFYVPFTEYNIFGDRVASSYYSETVMAANVSYNFLAGYDFKGLCIGANFKAGWKSIPNYTDNDTNQIIANSGLAQSSLAIMGDLGLMLQFNFLKFYASREPNIRIGLSAQNFGIALTGFGNKVVLDDSLPSLIAIGTSITFIKPITLSVDIKQPFDMNDLSHYHYLWYSMGYSIDFTSFLSLNTGIELKGSNPRFSIGTQIKALDLLLSINYSLDFTSSTTPLNRISLSTKIMLGDKGRSLISAMIDDYYAEGLKYYAQRDWNRAIECWNKVLKYDKRFDPAKRGIISAQLQKEMETNINNIKFFEFKDENPELE